MATIIVIAFLLIVLAFAAAYVWAVYRLFKRRRFLPAIVILAFPFLAHEAFQYYWYSKAIPQQIGITYPISSHVESGLRGGCGTIVFKLSDDTRAMIERQGLRFFVEATGARGYPGERYYKYAAWKETPVPPSWTSEGSWMLCSDLSHSDHAAIVAAAKSQGAYFTTKDEGTLVLVPSVGYIVYAFYD